MLFIANIITWVTIYHRVTKKDNRPRGAYLLKNALVLKQLYNVDSTRGDKEVEEMCVQR